MILFLLFQALDGAVKQYKNLSAKTPVIFFSVDQDAGKILCMACIPKVIFNFLKRYIITILIR